MRFKRGDIVIVNTDDEWLCMEYRVSSLREHINGEKARVVDPDSEFCGMEAICVVFDYGLRLYLSERMLLPIYSSHQEKILQEAMRDEV